MQINDFDKKDHKKLSKISIAMISSIEDTYFKMKNIMITVSGLNVSKFYIDFIKELKIKSDYFNWQNPDFYSEEEKMAFTEVFLSVITERLEKNKDFVEREGSASLLGFEVKAMKDYNNHIKEKMKS